LFNPAEVLTSFPVARSTKLAFWLASDADADRAVEAVVDLPKAYLVLSITLTTLPCMSVNHKAVVVPQE
jgi:hypothetical protein